MNDSCLKVKGIEMPIPSPNFIGHGTPAVTGMPSRMNQVSVSVLPDQFTNTAKLIQISYGVFSGYPSCFVKKFAAWIMHMKMLCLTLPPFYE